MSNFFEGITPKEVKSLVEFNKKYGKEQPVKKVRLMNSAMMPVPGTYRLVQITQEQFAEMVKEAHKKGELDSYIGYPQTASLIERISGVPVALSRDKTPVEDGDVLLQIRLKYRVADPSKKGEQVPEDFEFFVCHYSCE